MKLFQPEVFQGNLKKKHYFEGWYFKQVSANQDQVYAFIPGISLSKTDTHAFIQVINGITGETHYISYPLSAFQWKSDRLFVQIGESVFTKDYIDLAIDEPGIKVKGRLDYSGQTTYPKAFFAPGIMGWYAFVPFMECYHGVVSVNHEVSGSLEINSNIIDFNEGKGYIEKDWGTSFPECWIWLQCNSFSTPNASLFVSIAKIPWLGNYFMGFIAFLFVEGQFYQFSTYNRSKLTKVNLDKNLLAIALKNKQYTLTIQATWKNSGVLIAPERGNMNRRIKESIDSEVEIKLSDKKGNLRFNESSKGAGLEIIEKIFTYFPSSK